MSLCFITFGHIHHFTCFGRVNSDHYGVYFKLEVNLFGQCL